MQDLLQHIKRHKRMSYECDQCDYLSSEKKTSQAAQGTTS